MPDIVIAFFALGLCAGLLKSDLKVPDPVYQTLSILLMLILGLKGGQSLHGKFQIEMLSTLLPIMTLGLIIPLLCYPMLRKLVSLSVDDAASVAAHYGSVGAGTFAVTARGCWRFCITVRPGCSRKRRSRRARRNRLPCSGID